MSAYIVSDTHINALITWGVTHKAWFRSDYFAGHEEELASLLSAANTESVNYRYGTKDDFAPFKYKMVAVADHLKPVDILCMCDCLEYQSCEHPGYYLSEAYSLLIAIKGCAITELPGYDTAIRDLNDEEVDHA